MTGHAGEAGRADISDFVDRVRPSAVVLTVAALVGHAVSDDAVRVANRDVVLALTSVAVATEALVRPLQAEVAVASTRDFTGGGTVEGVAWHAPLAAGQVAIAAVYETAHVGVRWLFGCDHHGNLIDLRRRCEGDAKMKKKCEANKSLSTSTVDPESTLKEGP